MHLCCKQLPSIKTVEFYDDVLEDTKPVAARDMGRVEEIGIFPLGLVLNPGAVIPLHIFEMRYRQLFNQAWEGDTKVMRACLHMLACLHSVLAYACILAHAYMLEHALLMPSRHVA